MKAIKQAIVLVDAYKSPLRRHNTAGRYRVGAKTEKEAEELVRTAIGFGSVRFYYWEKEDSTHPKVKYKEVVKEIPSSRLVDTTYSYERPRHACEPLT
ncbi:MAG: hypothetical protein K6G10_06825 [Butyrivibrio sp.]|nr:hypothetical protein [Butyrivibrio sp.]